MKLSYDSKTSAFRMKEMPQWHSLYFPLFNITGIKSSITPHGMGDVIIDQNHMATLPMTMEDLHDSGFGRNIWFTINNNHHWAFNGQSPVQLFEPDSVEVEGGFLYHKVIKRNALFTVQLTSFVPTKTSLVEAHEIVFTSTSNKPIRVKPTVAWPIYGRSAENIRDHRHVSALLNRAFLTKEGIINQPAMSFDERGHLSNNTAYGVFARSENTTLESKISSLSTFVGAGSLRNPDYIFKSKTHSKDIGWDGEEIISGLRFQELTLEPKASFKLYFCMSIADNRESCEAQSDLVLSQDGFEQLLDENQRYWREKLQFFDVKMSNHQSGHWLKWISLQPILRRHYGCSFLPHHDYGRGGRGWRDLWQDLLALLLTEHTDIKSLLLNNYAGVRIDGSNATIIGDKPGEFLAERNNIVRVWSDHAAWPLLTTKLYIDQTGDIDFLWEKQTYFNDKFHGYGRMTRSVTHYQLLTVHGEIWQGSVFEHLLIQNLVAYHNVGKHGNVRLEDADWNDGTDMAKEDGETIAFTAFYADNLLRLADLLKSSQVVSVPLLLDIIPLLESSAISTEDKQHVLHQYFNHTTEGVSGQVKDYPSATIIEMLTSKAHQMFAHVRQNEWIENDKIGYFNSYRTQQGLPLDSIASNQMNLIGQTFALMGSLATKPQAVKIIKACDELLCDSTLGGYRLSTNQDKLRLDMGRLFGFAYGHKENGAVFSHMAVMYANALYKRGYAIEGSRVLKMLKDAAQNHETSLIYPGLPEYFDPKARGMYPYLTGSASWYLLTIVQEVFGIKGRLGKLTLNPQLISTEFIDGRAEIVTMFNKEKLHIVYHNPKSLDVGEYKIKQILHQSKPMAFTVEADGVSLSTVVSGVLEVWLDV